ncbi:MAG: Slp family lipoprotein [Granulosicoccus sp.]|nr:Slp family lipoprotein [Granulosicoccus sp.]
MPATSRNSRLYLMLMYCISIPMLLGACVSVPKPIASEPQVNVTIKDVQAEPSTHTGQQVRWGGSIVGVVNNSEHSDVLIVARPLSRTQRPIKSDQSPGRFIARIPAFVEPETYTEGREVTITGTVSGLETLPIGQAQYDYPVIAVDGKHLWAKRSTVNRTYHHSHGFPHSHHSVFWWEDDHHHRWHNGVYGHIFLQGDY